MKTLLLLLSFAAWLNGATATLFPTSDNTAGGWITAPLWSKVGADDGTNITSASNSTTAVVFNLTCPSNVLTITAMTIHVKASASATSGKIPAITVAWSAGGNSKASGNLTTTPTTFTGIQATSLTISKATCNSSTLTITPTVSGTGAATTVVVDSVGIDIVYTAGGKVRHNTNNSGELQ